MSKEILNIEELQKLSKAGAIVQIPDFEGTGEISVRLQQPRLMNMASQGNIPNHLMAIASSMLTGNPVKGADNMKTEDKIKMVDDTMELYCITCMVEPTYEEFKDIMTDDQKSFIFMWGTGQVDKLDTFRNNSTDGKNNNDSEKV